MNKFNSVRMPIGLVARPVAAMLFLNGCAVVTPDVANRPALPQVTDTTLSSVSLAPISLRNAVRLGILASADVRSSDLTIDQNANEAVIARAALYPELYAEIQPSTDTDAIATASAGLRYTLYDFGERAARIKAADAGIEKARYEVLEEIDNAIFDAANAYFDVVVDVALEDAARAYKRRVDKLEKGVRARVEIGVASSVDLNDIATGQLNAQSAVLSADTDEKNSRAELASLIGVSPKGVTSISSVQSILQSGGASAALPDDLSEIPQIAARFESLRVAQYELKAEKAGLLPRIGARLGVGIAPGNSGVVAGPELSEVLSLGGGRKQVVRNAELEVLRAEQLLDEEIRETKLGFTQAQTSLAAEKGKLANLSKIVSLAIATRDVMLGEYEIGNRDLRDLVDAEKRIYDATASQLEGRRDLLRAQLTYLMAVNEAGDRLYSDPE